MKEIRKPDQPKKENWFTRSNTPGQNAQPVNDQKATKIATGVIIAALVCYVLYSMFAGQNDTDNQPNNTDMAAESSISDNTQQSEQPIETQTIQNHTHETEIYNRIPEAKMPLDDGYDVTVSGRTILKSPSGTDAIMIWIPTGYVAKTNSRSVVLKPDDMDESITENEPLSIQWNNMPYTDELKQNGYVDARIGTMINDFTQYDYTVIDKYQYLSSDTQSSTVFVVKQTVISKSDPPETYEYWQVWIDTQASNRAYPILSIPPDNLKNILNDRYPDVPSLARAIFIPKEGEPEWNPNMNALINTTNQETKDSKSLSENQSD